jgi:PAS domain S-box-containing protein
MPFLHQRPARDKRYSIRGPFRRFMDAFVLTPADEIRDELGYWRTRIALSALAAGLVLSLAALIPALIMAFGEGRWLLLAADISAFALTGSLLVYRRMGMKLRAALMLLVIFMVGVFIVREVGYLSGGPAWLFCFAVMASVLLGLKAALAATFLNAVVLVALAWMTDHDTGLSNARLITAWANFIFLNSLAAISVSVLVDGLQSLNRRTRQATAALEAERVALLKTREDLKEEIRVREKSEKALQESERKYRLLAENISDVIWTMDLDFRLTYVSPAGQAMQGWTQEEFLGLRLEQILTPDSVEKAMAELSRRYARNKRAGSYRGSSTVEVEMYRKDGSTVWAEVTASFMLNAAGLPVGVLGVARDITERRRAQRENELLLERLNRSRKMEAIGTLAGGVAHDLNNVLSGIVSYPDLLLLDMPADSPLRRPIEVMRDSGQKAAAIVQDLLTLARRAVAVSEVVNLNGLVADYLDSPEFARLKSFHPHVEVNTRLEGGLANIAGSPIHLSKTIMNLVSNAAEAMPEGGRISITTGNRTVETPVHGFHVVPRGQYAVLQVADSGVGIAAEDFQRTFSTLNKERLPIFLASMER